MVQFFTQKDIQTAVMRETIRPFEISSPFGVDPLVFQAFGLSPKI